MRNKRGGTMVVDLQTNPYNHYQHHRRPKFGDILRSNHGIFSSGKDTKNNNHHGCCEINSASTMSSTTTSGDSSPSAFSPWAQVSSPAMPWMRTNSSSINQHFNDHIFEANGLIGSITREEGHIYSLAAYGDLLYTGSDSKNIRVWKNLRDYSGFKSTSGLVKDIVIYGDRIFTGHQDGKIRVWRVSSKKPGKHKRVGSLPKFKDVVKSTINPKHYMEVRRKNNNMVKVRHYDAVSCLSLNEELGLLYSTSWDRTLKVWRISDSKCLESIDAHDDAINSVFAGFDSLVFTGSADGLVNYWEREKHLSHGGALRGHKLAVLCLATGGNLLMSGSADKNICVWRRNSGGGHVCLSVLTGHMGPVKCLAVEEERRRRQREAVEQEEKGPGSRRWIVYSGSLDKSVKVWRVSEHAPTWREMDAPGSSGRRSSSSPPGGEKGKPL